jgi:phenylalanyl-tRNA synthetase beta chain
MTSSQTAKVVVNKNKIAELGKIKDDLLDYFDIENEVFAAELDLNKIFSFIKTDFKIKSIPKFPHIKRDLAIVVKEDLESKVIREEIEKIGQPLIKEVELFDVYTGKQIPQGYKSLAYSIKYQSQSRTLTDEEVDQIQEEIHRSLVENLKAQIR